MVNVISRYTKEEIGQIWTDESKFKEWLETELAVIKVREEEGRYPKDTYETIKSQADFSISRIREIEKVTKHDLLAFVQAVCENIDQTLRKYIHQDITSYDTEEPAQARQVLISLDLIITAAENLYDSLIKRAEEFRHLKTAGRTHAKKAQITIFGRYFLVYADMVDFVIHKLKDAKEEMRYSKLSGALGCYNRSLSPKFEEEVLGLLGLKQSRIATQIVQRHRLAYAVQMLSLTGAVVCNIADNFWLWIHREVANEPFERRQKGSSAMPHKKNAIISEQMIGLTERSLILKSISALLNVKSREDRDISHSSVERTEITDAFILAFYVLTCMKPLVDGLIIYKDRVKKEIIESYKLVFSERVKSFLEEKVSKDLAYEIVQDACFEAWDKERNLDEVLLEDERFLEAVSEVKEAVEKKSPLPQDFLDLFNEDLDLVHIPEIYKRFGL